MDARTRRHAIVLAACLVLLFWGTIAKRWFGLGDDSVGLAGVEVCHMFCELKMWTDAHAPMLVTVLGITGFLGGLNAFGFGAHAFAMVLKGKPEKIKMQTTIWLSAITAIACIGFLVRIGTQSATYQLSYPGFLAIAGSVGLPFALRASR